MAQIPSALLEMKNQTQRIFLTTYHDISYPKLEKIFYAIFIKGYFKALLENTFFSKKRFFVFYRNFGFNLEKSSYHYSQLKKHLKVDPETRSYDFLMKTHEKNPMCQNYADLGTILEYAMITSIIIKDAFNS